MVCIPLAKQSGLGCRQSRSGSPALIRAGSARRAASRRECSLGPPVRRATCHPVVSVCRYRRAPDRRRKHSRSGLSLADIVLLYAGFGVLGGALVGLLRPSQSSELAPLAGLCGGLFGSQLLRHGALALSAAASVVAFARSRSLARRRMCGCFRCHNRRCAPMLLSLQEPIECGSHISTCC